MQKSEIIGAFHLRYLFFLVRHDTCEQHPGFLVSSFSDMAAILENDRTLRTRFVTYESEGQARVCLALLSNLLLFPTSYKKSHFQNEGRCKIFLNLICMRI